MNIFTAKKYETKIKSAITVSKVYLIDEICDITNINKEDVVTLTEKMISKGNNNNFDYRMFKNAHINYKTNEVVLDETKANSFSDKLGKMTSSLVEKLTFKEEPVKEEWKCVYCQGVNAPELLSCNYCGAKKEK